MARANNVTASGPSTAGRHGNPLLSPPRAIAVSIREQDRVDKFANTRQPRRLDDSAFLFLRTSIGRAGGTGFGRIVCGCMGAERVERKFRDRAPHTVKGLGGREGEFFVCENITPMAVAGFFGAGVPSNELPEHNKKSFDQAPKSVWDAAYRIADQERDGVQAEVIYTSMGMPLFGLDDAELRAALFRAFNDWACEYCSYDLKRLIPLGLITLEDIPGAVAELTRIAKKGMRGAMIWAEPPSDKPYSDPVYEPFWAAAADLNMALSLHILTAR